MLDASGQIIYVGKAKHLKKRVSSYFNQSDKAAKTKALVEQIDSIEVSITKSETEALVLESQLIKEHKPKYNVLMRDDKSYPFLHLKLTHAYPSLGLARCKHNPQKKGYFGPYPSVLALKDTLNLLQKVFKLRNCSDADFQSRKRPCLQYQIGRCTAPCVGHISKEAYNDSVKDAVQFLEGKSSYLMRVLTDRMEDAAKRMAFEDAGRFRDQIKHLRATQEQQGMSSRGGDADILVAAIKEGMGAVEWVAVRDGQVLYEEAYFPDMPELVLEKDALIEAFLVHFYLELPSRIPKLLLVDETFKHQNTWAEVLQEKSGHACKIQAGGRGVKARWLGFAKDNLARAFDVKLTSKTLLEARFVSLEKALALKAPIAHMVCFDISHTRGQDTVASCVVFDRHGPLKSAYRKLNIRDITPGDDYAAIEQAVVRYIKLLQKTHTDIPTLFLIDGGKGQVSAAQKAFAEVGVYPASMIGVAKGASRKAGQERIILSETGQEISLGPDSKALHLIQHIRDEAHRFAITTHRKKRQKSALSSSLESIEGIGTNRRKALLNYFGGIRPLMDAPVEEIKKVHGVSHALAEKIYQHFHS